MFHGDPEENDLFQAIATVTSLVLQIGEAGHREQTKASAEKPAKPTASCDGALAADDEWTVSYAQILASLLTEQALVNFFDKPADLTEMIAQAKRNQYQQRAGLLSLQSGTR